MMAQHHPDPTERQDMCGEMWDMAESGDMMDMSADNAIYRAYSVLNVKNVNGDQRIVSGIATTPTPDRIGDIIDPMGAKFAPSMPCLWQHQNDKPIGVVKFSQPTAQGIRFEARLPQVTEPGVLKDRVDEAWQSVKYGLVAGASIGFRALKGGKEKMDGGGILFKSVEILELSLVTVPANGDCSIDIIRSLDRKSLAALGTKAVADKLTNTPGASGKPTVKIKPEVKDKRMATIAEQITSLEATRAAKAAALADTTTKSVDEGRTMDDAEDEQFDNLQREVEAIDKTLSKLRIVEKMNGQAAKPVVGYTPPEATAARSGIVVKREEQLPPGIPFARYAMCIAAAKGNLWAAQEIAKQRYGENSELVGVLKYQAHFGSFSDPSIFYQRAPVAGAVTTDNEWAGPLVFTQRFSGDFVEYLRPMTILGRFGTGNIPGLRRVPFNVNIASQTTGGSAYWVGEGKSKPLTAWQYGQTTLRFAKAAAIAVLTDEMVRFSTPSAEALVRDELANALAAKLDVDFIDPTKAAVANVSPASITNGATSHLSVGNYGDAVRTDIETLFNGFIGANIAPTNAVWIMSATKALGLSLLRNALGQPEFPGISMNGGTLEGIPVITSQFIGELAHTGGEIVVLVNTSDVWLADDGGVTVDASREASLEMVDTGTEDASGGVAAAMVSMFQTNSTAVRVERYINWAKRRTQGVQVLSNVFWGSASRSGT